MLSPIVVPIALSLTLGESVDRDKFLGAAIQLSWTVVLPVVVGYLISHAIPGQQERAVAIGSVIANLTILWIVAYVVAANRERLADLQPRLLAALLLLNLLGYAAGNWGGYLMGLPDGMKRALTLEVGMQNAGLGTALVTSLFPDPAVAIPPALYTFGCMLTGTVLARIWSAVPSGVAENLD
jgi:BASS family bile acid:Na+ symporter